MTGSLWRLLLRALTSPSGRLGAIIIALLTLFVFVAPWMLPDPSAMPDLMAGAVPPGAGHPFGTDQLNRDVLSRVVSGGQISLSVAGLAVLLAVTLGALVGGLAGFYGGWLDSALMRMVDGALAIPRLFLLLLLVAVWEQMPLGALVLVLGATGWFATSRIVRGEVLRLREAEFVLAATALGAGPGRIILRHLLPNVAGPILVAATLGVGDVILLEAGLSYLGIGVRPPTPSWGGMILDARPLLTTAPWTSIFPGLAIATTVLAVNLLGDALRGALDPPERMTPLLEVEDLRITFPTRHGTSHPVDGVSFSVARGELLALVGESGCGKSLTSLALLRLVPPPGQIQPGSAIRLDGTDVLGLGPEELRSIRGRRIGMIFQDPMTSLNPVFTIADQIGESVRAHQKVSKRAARARALELLREVGIPDPEERLDVYPHQMSGGMRQRVMIAIALASEPEMLIADEPTTALDVTVQAQILELLDGLRAARGMAVLLITHDLGIVAGRADRVAVMYAGRLVEEATTAELFARPSHPYTKGLLASVPRITGAVTRLTPIAGTVPAPTAWPAGCRFHPRCPAALPRCATDDPPALPVGNAHRMRCWLAEGRQA